MAKPNYGFEKRQRELAKKKKQDEKDARKREARAAAAAADQPAEAATPEPAAAEPAEPGGTDLAYILCLKKGLSRWRPRSRAPTMPARVRTTTHVVRSGVPRTGVAADAPPTTARDGPIASSSCCGSAMLFASTPT